ncbi:MAG: phosphoribosylglycinamide formyltransferase [Elusimicrobiota bacterium]|jgi:phosphoribosylglycinamide formyltransferase-1|nr:phosphoribosylglycinamide formyltransferase [Elusimicrobiota bacterium]
MKNLAILVSGGGSNLQSIIDECKSGILKDLAQVCLVVSNNPGAFALERAKKENIAAICINRRNYSNEIDFNSDILKELKLAKTDIICLAGYMRLLGQNIVSEYSGRILNMHPALLPKFGGQGMYGHFVHEAVIKSGEKKSGATVHFVNERYDDGKIIIQREVPVLENDAPETLAKRVLEIEHKIYPEAIRKII